jgi:PAS domain-containing protein
MDDSDRTGRTINEEFEHLRRCAEEALRESEQKYRALFDSATDAIYILDLDGNFIDVNRTAHTRLETGNAVDACQRPGFA